MVKFTCLYSWILSMKPKKTVECSIKTMHKTLEDCISNDVKSSQGDYLNELYLKSEGNNSNYSSQQEIGVHFSDKIRKSISLWSGLGRERRASVGSDSENEKRENEDGTVTHEALLSDLGINESIFSIGNKPFNPPLMSKSKSLQNICSSTQIVAPHSQSVDDLTALDSGIISKNKEYIDLDTIKGVCDSYEHVNNKFHGESSSCALEIMTNKDNKIKRIVDWVYDLQNCSPLEETDDDNQILGGSNIVNNSISAKCDDKLNADVEVAKRYISSLSLSATAAYLANHGLVVVPLLSAFVALRTLNLSGNFIVKITVGALPRALHVPNLSKNSITTIEGLRELTRLRVLDLSYNRIIRIGYGLASCTSLKELYLSGNKISEVEGLHGLLKINVLHLRFNKISTAKSLGQLAANYNSLQAISLKGNPSQKNVGDKNIKKCLHCLLPLLSYYNAHNVKAKYVTDGPD